MADSAIGRRRRFYHVWETRTRDTDRGAGGRGHVSRVPGSFLPRDFLRAVGLTVTAWGVWIGGIDGHSAGSLDRLGERGRIFGGFDDSAGERRIAASRKLRRRDGLV